MLWSIFNNLCLIVDNNFLSIRDLQYVIAVIILIIHPKELAKQLLCGQQSSAAAMLGDIQLTKRLIIIALVLLIVLILKEYVFVYPQWLNIGWLTSTTLTWGTSTTGQGIQWSRTDSLWPTAWCSTMGCTRRCKSTSRIGRARTICAASTAKTILSSCRMSHRRIYKVSITSLCQRLYIVSKETNLKEVNHFFSS